MKLDKPFEAVAHGALALSEFAEIDDYLRHSYAIRLWQPYDKTYTYFTLIEKGAQYPGARSQPLTSLPEVPRCNVPIQRWDG